MVVKALPRPGQTRYEILSAMVGFTKENAHAPTMVELADLVGLANRSTVHHHLAGLIEDELVEHEHTGRRGYFPTARGKKLVALLAT